MKHKKILRILGIALIFSLFAALAPVTPALGAETIVLNPTQGKVGTSINYSVSGYATHTSEYYIDIYMSDQSASIGTVIDVTQVTRYKLVVSGEFLEEDGTTSGSFAIPTSLNEGTVGTLNPLTLTAGTTYYVYACARYTGTSNPNKTIKAIATITITPGPTLDPLSPASGQPGTDVMVSGVNFPASTALVMKIDGVNVTPKSGDVATRSSGIFINTITIPSTAAAGAHTVSATAGTSTASATFTVTASASLSPLNPVSGPPDTDITITGANFPANTALVFQFGTTAVTPKAGSLMTGSNGGFMSIITVPSNAADGGYIITVSAGSTSVTAPFTVTAPPTSTPPTSTPPTSTPPTSTPPTSTPPTSTPPTGIPTTPSLNPDTSLQLLSGENSVGAAITLIGMDFAAGATVVFSYDGTPVATGTVNSDGFVTASFNVPAGTHGSHTILANDGQNWDTLDFIVESTAPDTPQPNAPRMGANVKTPILFDWDDAIDDSLPITYKLQIATDEDFTEDSIVLDIADIEISEYTITEDEAAELDDPEATYYWREKAVDGALNESDWTGAGEFTVAQPFRFIGWPLYLTISIGAVVFFLLGLWIGRRTAFYY